MGQCFKLRNEIVHGNALMNFLQEAQHNVEKDKKGMDELYFNLKNLIIKVFYYYINKGLYLNANTQKINHELIFTFLPQGIHLGKLMNERKAFNLCYLYYPLTILFWDHATGWPLEP